MSEPAMCYRDGRPHPSEEVNLPVQDLGRLWPRYTMECSFLESQLPSASALPVFPSYPILFHSIPRFSILLQRDT